MIVKAFCAAEFAESTRRASGATLPLLAPPVTTENFDPHALEGADLLYLDLHGAPGVAYWYGDGHAAACSAEQVRSIDLSETVVFSCNCYLGDADSPMLDALLAAGAEYVVSGAGENFGGARKTLGASELGLHFRVALEHGRDAPHALAWAKEVLRLELLGSNISGNAAASQAIQDTLGFQLFERKAVTP